MRKLTDHQMRLLNMLDRGPQTTRALADMFGVSRANFPLAIPEDVHKAMRRLEDRELVRRVEDNPIHWQLTAAGRKAADGNI